jgi:hypothetical protein
MTTTLTFVISCAVLGLGLAIPFTCWGHVMFKCCQHTIDDFKTYVGLTFIIHFVENYHMDKKKWEGVAKLAQNMYGYWSAPTKV